MSSNPWAPDSARLASAQAAKAATGVKLVLCIGGAGRAQFFGHMSRKKATRKAFAKNLVSLAADCGLDGIDIDANVWDPADPASLKSFGLVMRQLRKTLSRADLTLSVTFHPGQEAGLSQEVRPPPRRMQSSRVPRRAAPAVSACTHGVTNDPTTEPGAGLGRLRAPHVVRRLPGLAVPPRHPRRRDRARAQPRAPADSRAALPRRPPPPPLSPVQSGHVSSIPPY